MPRYSTVPIYDHINLDYNCGSCDEIHNLRVDLDYNLTFANVEPLVVKDYMQTLIIRGKCVKYIMQLMKTNNTAKFQKEIDKANNFIVIPEIYNSLN